jgi:hypothetical protein
VCVLFYVCVCIFVCCVNTDCIILVGLLVWGTILVVPTCKSNSDELIGAMRHETVTVRCEMAADPPLVRFHWTFNNSGVEVNPVPQARFRSNGTVSLLNYTPASEMDYGTLACWGSNKIGEGKHGPCYFQIVSAGKPFPPKNCSVFNETADSLSVSCVEGYVFILLSWRDRVFSLFNLFSLTLISLSYYLVIILQIQWRITSTFYSRSSGLYCQENQAQCFFQGLSRIKSQHSSPIE